MKKFFALLKVSVKAMLLLSLIHISEPTRH